ncbi:unnamed protein product [Phaedon cochleariae]|uniref:Peptidase S1 domain-containing protein n=1 Tax=Phaedon cochleariae TaxID=80249 RepID=A0A9P0DVQ0_PHACE|nr:unnamed protein product [Phaedon cochleariae]
MKLSFISVICLLVTVSRSKADEANLRVYNGWIVEKPIPFIVSIKKDNNKHVCGGTIVAAQWILTAAHCVANQTNLSVLAGAVDNSKLDERSQLVGIDHVVIHDQYDYDDSENIENDIALLYLDEPLIFNENVENIPLMSESSLEEAVRENSTSFIAGWGSTEDAYASKKLKWALVSLLDSEECIQDIPESCHNFNPESHICTGPLTVDKTGAGLKDDGGPLVINWTLAGVINHGDHDPETEPDSCHKSTIYTSVPYYLDWINDIICIKSETSGLCEEDTPDPRVDTPASEEVTSSPEEVFFYQVEITLTPTNDPDNEYSLSYRVWWFPRDDDDYYSEENNENNYTEPSDETSLEQDGQYDIKNGRIIIITLQFFFVKTGDIYNTNLQDIPVELRSAIKTIKA